MILPLLTRVAAFSGFAGTASRKLGQLDAATSLGGLARPGNPMEELKGLHNGWWSIHINDKWRRCSKCPEGCPSPSEVEIVDYN